jgi:YVTN family beta-propeller protein
MRLNLKLRPLLLPALALIALASAPVPVRAQCGSGPMILLDGNATFAYERPTVLGSPYISTAGNQLTVVGLVKSFCAPFDDLNAADPDTEFTVVYSGLTSLGTTVTTLGSTKFYTSSYGPGTFAIYRHNPRVAFSSAAAMPGSPPNATVPSIYQGGTVILSGTLTNFVVSVTKTNGHPATGSYRSDFAFTGGTLVARLNGSAGSQMHGLWCVSGCLPPAGGYGAQLDGSFNFDLALDTDGDGVPDYQDPCPTISAAGQDADANGCVDPTSTMHHVETWANTSLPLHFSFVGNGPPNITDGSGADAVRRAYQTWENVPGAQLSVIEDPSGSLTAASGLDGVNLVTFHDSSYPFSPSVLAVTPTMSFTKRSTFHHQVVLPGQIVDADIMFNPTASFSTPTTPGDWDLQSVATHEIGHFFGLSHSGVRTATMFYVQQPGNVASTLKSDDMSAIAAAFPSSGLAAQFGTIRGSVLRDTTGLPVPGVLVTAVHVNADGAPLDTVASDYTREDGTYALFRLPPGDYGVHIQALDGTVLDGLSPAYINSRLAAIAQTGFDPEWYSDGESAYDDPTVLQRLTVSPGALFTNVNVITNIDVTPPYITNVSPLDASTNVPTDASVAVAFSEPVNANTIATSLRVHKSGQTARIAGSGLLANHGQTLFFTPDLALDFGATYVVEFTTDLTDQRGVHLAAPFSSSFTTGGLPPLALNAVQPQVTPPGGVVTLTGQGFLATDAIVVHFVSGATDLAVNPVSVIGGSIVVQVPGPAVPGANDVSIVVGSGSTAATSNTVPLTVVTPPAQSIPVAEGSPIVLPFVPSDVALSYDGNMAYVVGDGGFVTISLNPGLDFFRVPISRSTQPAQHIRLTPDGTRAVITLPASGGAMLVDALMTSGTLGAMLDSIPLPGSPAGVAIDPSGQRAYFTDPAHLAVHAVEIRAGLATSGQILRTYSSASALNGGIAIQPDGSRLVLGSSSGLFTIGIADNSQNSLAPFATSGTVAIDPSGLQVFAPEASGRLATGSTNGSLTPALVNTGGQPRDAAVSRFGQSAFIVNGPLNLLQVIDANPGSGTFRSAVGQVATGLGPVALSLSGNGSLIAVANAGSRSLSLYGTSATGPVLSRVTPPIALAGDQAVAVNGGGGTSTFSGSSIDLGSGAYAVSRGLDAGAGFVVAPLSQRSASATVQLPTNERSLALPFQIVDPIPSPVPLQTGRVLPLSSASCDNTVIGTVDLMRTSPDGRFLAVYKTTSVCQNNIDLFEITDDGALGFGALEGTLQTSSAGVRDFAFTADGKQLWVTLAPIAIRVFNTDPASPQFTQEIVTLTGAAAGSPLGIAADPLGRRILVSGAGLRFFRPDFTIEKTLTTFATTASGMAITPDGHFAAIGDAGRAYFVDVDRETLMAFSPFTGTLNNFVNRIAITTDGKRALGVFADGTVSVWIMDPSLGTVGTETYHGTPVPGTIRLQSPVPGVDGHSILFGDGLGNDIVKLDLSVTPPVATVRALPSAARTIQRSADGRRLFGASWTATAPVVSTLRMYSLSPASQMALVSGGSQTAVAGTTLPLPITVRVTDGAGHPQEGVIVRFNRIGAINGTFPGTTAVQLEKISDANGQAQTFWTMPASGSSASLTVTALGVTGATLVVNASIALNDNQIAPVVTEFGPPNNSNGINAGSSVFVKFNQKMDLASLNSHFGMFANGTPVAGTLHLENLGATAIFQPNAAVAYSARCSLLVRAGALDQQGQTMATSAHAGYFTQSPPTIAITSLSPPAGPLGSQVVINGTGFSPTLLSNSVTFNGALATVSSTDLVSLVANVPLAASSGPVTVNVGASASNPLGFSVLAPSTRPVRVVGTVPVDPGIRDIEITPDGTRLYITQPASNAVLAYDVATATQIASIGVGNFPQGIAILPDGSRAYVINTRSNDVSVIDINPASSTYNTVIKTIPVGVSPVSIEVSALGPAVFVLNQGSGTLMKIDARTGNATVDQVTTSVNVGSGTTSIHIVPDGTLAYVTNGIGFEIVDLKTQQVTTAVNLGSGGTSIHITPDGTLAFVLTNNGQLLVVDLNPGTQQYQVSTSVNVGSGATSIHITPDGTQAYVTNGDGNVVLVFQITVSNTGASTIQPHRSVTLTLIATIDVGQFPTSLVFDPLGKPLAFVVNYASGTITLIGLPTGLPPIPIVFEIDPGRMDMHEMCKWVAGVLQPPAPYTPASIVATSIRLNGTLAPDLTVAPVIGDANHDGIPDLKVQFPLKDLLAMLPSGNKVPVTATGAFTDDRRFSGTDSVKIHHSHLVCSSADNSVLAGSATPLCWDKTAVSSAQWVAVLHSLDHGECWELDDDHVANTGTFTWTAPNALADSALVAIEFVDSVVTVPGSSGASTTVSGSLALSGYFGIQGTTATEPAPATLAFAPMRPNPAIGNVSMRFGIPRAAAVKLDVFDLQGRHVRALAGGVRAAGWYEVQWNGQTDGDTRIGPGLYFVRFEAMGRQIKQRLVWLL